MLLRRLFASGFIASFLFNQASYINCSAQEASQSAAVTAHHCHQHSGGNWNSQPTNLDLSSTTASATAGHIAQTPININVGGATMTVTQGMSLTPAQMIAAYQIARTGQQSILIGADGAAVGGSLTIGSRLANHLNNLVIPNNVTVIDKASTLNLLGNLTNAGTIQAIGSQNISTVNINASNIYNNGLINSLLNLNLSALNTISNLGTISSAANLNLQAPQIINSGNLISQAANIGLVTNALSNSGIIQAGAGSVNISALTGNALNINNIGGQISARDTILALTAATVFDNDGNILQKAGIDLKGGVLTAQDINFTSPDGKIEISTEKLNGAVNIDGGVAAVHVKGGNLNIASLNLSGDPIITNSDGDIAIPNFAASPFAPSDFIVLASGNITAQAGTTSVSTNGGNVVMSAGYLFVGADDACTNCTGLYSISHTPSTTGGSISLSGVTISTNGANGINGIVAGVPGSAGSNGGNITMQSTAGITLGTLTASGGTGGNGAAGNGFGAVNGAAGGNGGNGGNIVLSSSGDIVVGSVTVNGGAGGNGGSGALILSGTGGDGGIGAIGGMSGNVNISSGGDVTTAALSAVGGNGGAGGSGGSGDDGGAGGNGAIAGNGGLITIFSQAAISSPGAISTNGGNGGSGGLGGSATFTAGNGGDGEKGGNAGIILLSAATSVVAGSSGAIQSTGGNGGDGGSGGTIQGDAGSGGNAGMITLIGGTTVGTTGQTLNNVILARGGSIGLGGGSATFGLQGIVLLEAGSTIHIGADFSISTGSLAMVTGYGTSTPVITKVLPLSNYHYVSGDLDGSGVSAAVGATFNVFNPITVAQNPNGNLDISAITSASNQGVFTLTGGTVSSASSGSLSALVTPGQDVIVIAQGDISAGSAMSVNVAASNGNSFGGQVIIVSGAGSGAFVTSGGSYTNPFMILSSAGSNSFISLDNSEFTTNSNMVYASGDGNCVLGGVVTSGSQPSIAGANGLPGGQIIMASTGPVAIQSVGGSSGLLLANGGDGADGDATRISGGTGGMGGIVSMIAGDTTSFVQFISGAESNGGNGGTAFTGGTDGNGGNGGIIQVRADFLLSEADICVCGGLGNKGGNGGTIDITLTSRLLPGFLIGGSSGGSYVNGVLGADGADSGNGGSITVNSSSAITLAVGALVSAISGTSAGGIGGAINLLSDGVIISANSTVDTSGKSAGGNIYYRAGSITSVSDEIIARNELGTSGIGGTIKFASLGDLNVSSVVSANGSTYGGRIDILADRTITNGGTIGANTAGGGIAGGMIQISSLSGGNVTLVNNGGINATDIGTNTTGEVGINGLTNSITISGSGAITAGEFVNIGNLNPVTLAIIPPFVVLDSYAGTYTNAKGNINIQNTIITNLLQVSDPPPTSGVGGTTARSTWAQQALAYLLNLAYWNAFLAGQQNLLNEQIGTRIATDYTPWTTYPYEPNAPINFPLQGNVSVEQIAGAGQALFTANSFNAEEQNALAQQGIVFGSKTGGNFFDLQKGFVLFMPTGNIQVQTKEGLISIPKGAIAWVMETGNDAAVYDMHDDLQTGKIKVVANGKELTLAPGTEVLMTRDGKADFNTLNPGKEIGVRNIREKDMGEGIKAYIADFTISGGMMNVPVIRHLLKSNNPEQRAAADKMLKNATILSDLTGGAGAYKTK